MSDGMLLARIVTAIAAILFALAVAQNAKAEASTDPASFSLMAQHWRG
jgi:hypothetical protein